MADDGGAKEDAEDARAVTDAEGGDGVDGLSFDHAEVDRRGASCTRCRGVIRTEYWDVDSVETCASCVKTLRYGPPGTSAGGRAARALALGGIAATLSGLAWWGIRAATGFEIGLIAVAVGLAVGFAVRVGSHAMGGAFYQAMAVALTYLAIVSTYVPEIMDGILHPETDEVSVRDILSPSMAVAQPVASDPSGVTPAGEPSPDDEPWMPLVFVIACILALIAPFLMGFENIIGIAIIAFALWEAWRVNKRPFKRIAGPYALGAPDEPTPTP